MRIQQRLRRATLQPTPPKLKPPSPLNAPVLTGAFHPSDSVMRLFVGLGNPGSRYARNRHNVGFMAVDAIARAHNAAPWRQRFQGSTAEVLLGGERTLLLKPATYMNDSGRAVAEAQRFYKIALADVVVFHDELDLPPGKLRVKIGGGNAGHNGLRSITAQ